MGFDDTGRITGLKPMMVVNCGFSADLSGPVADRAIFHADNADFFRMSRSRPTAASPIFQSHTAFRGLGGPRGMIVIKAILGDIAWQLGLDLLAIKTGANLAVPTAQTSYLVTELRRSGDQARDYAAQFSTTRPG